MARNSEPRKVDPNEHRKKFEEFTAGADWRSLPLKIKLLVVNLWRTERDVPAKPRSDD